jgi:acyl-[acyl-carrier-protein]-phospholipid O-acyltransferase/long-chain-fatty-acid--[acyl-carrier-protein] ligase
MLVVVLAWAFFSLIAVMVLQAVLDFKTLLDLTDKATSYLNLPLVVGLIIGSGSASLLSKDRIYMPLVPVGAAGITVIFVSLWLVPPSYVFTTVCLIGLGTFGGLYLVPLQSWIQSRSPKEKRGRILGTSYFISFTFIALGGALYWLLRSQLGLNVLQMLLFCGVLTLISTGYLNWRIRGLFKEDIPNE